MSYLRRMVQEEMGEVLSKIVTDVTNARGMAHAARMVTIEYAEAHPDEEQLVVGLDVEGLRNIEASLWDVLEAIMRAVKIDEAAEGLKEALGPESGDRMVNLVSNSQMEALAQLAEMREEALAD